MKKKLQLRKPSKRTVIISVILVVVLALITAAIVVRQLYINALKPLSNSQNIILIEVPSGASVQEIGTMLEDKAVIREDWAFVRYVQTNQITENLKAGTYALRPSQSVQEIVEVLAQGEVASDLVTIIPGTRIDQVEATLINSGFEPKAVERALDPKQYRNHPALVDKPVSASLEGYLYPESFQKTAQTDPQDIIRSSLDEMQKRLTPSVRAGFTKQGLTVHEGITLASIIEREVPHEEDRAIVAQVFLKRLREGMPLESDATASYGAILDGEAPSLTYDSPYNTYYNKGLPPGPISNVEETAINAVIKPTSTDYLFFVSGDDGTTHFAKTLDEHEANVEKYCKIQCR